MGTKEDRTNGNVITGTGLIVAIVLSLLGVEDEAIAHDYSLTDLGLAQRKEAIVQHLMETPGLFGDRARAETMVSSRYVYSSFLFLPRDRLPNGQSSGPVN